jgi:parallel beta-helix repeat protein
MGGYLTVGAVVDSNEIAYSGGTPGQGGSTACTKWAGDEVGVSNLTITNNYVHHCNTTGLWLDGAGSGSVIANNLIENNVRGGIEWEVSLGGKVHDNTLNGNGVAIFISNSQDVEVYANDIAQPSGFALQLFVDASRLNIVNDYFHDNHVDLTAHSASEAVGLSCIGTTDCASFGTPNDNRFDGNAYNTAGRATSPFWTWGGSGLDWNGWRAIPEDAIGSAQ